MTEERNILASFECRTMRSCSLGIYCYCCCCCRDSRISPRFSNRQQYLTWSFENNERLSSSTSCARLSLTVVVESSTSPQSRERRAGEDRGESTTSLCSCSFILCSIVSQAEAGLMEPLNRRRSHNPERQDSRTIFDL